MFMSVTLQAAGHLGKDYSENLRSIKSQPLKSLRQLFQVTGKLIRDQTEIPLIDWQQLVWQRATLLSDKAVLFATAINDVFSDSVLCMGGISPGPVKAWKGKINWFVDSRQFRELDRMWTNFHRIHNIGNSQRDSKDDD